MDFKSFLAKRLRSPTSSPMRRSPTFSPSHLIRHIIHTASQLETSLSPSLTLSRVRKHKWVWQDSIYLFHLALWIFWITLMQVPVFPLKVGIPILYSIAILIPLTSQFFFPALPIFSWVITFFSARFVPVAYRPPISVSLLPTLESVLYGANISDILTRFTHPFLDILAWIPYGVVHYTGPFFIAAFLWLFSPKRALKFWANAFGYMNLTGVICQTIFPCAAPWYELIYGLTPADYSVQGSPGGLARIDALFHSQGYTATFAASPIVFGAFPSLHAGWATMEALFISHFFPRVGKFAWAYAAILYWATMYLTHHYLIDVVGGACLATASFYFFMPSTLRNPTSLPTPYSQTIPRNKYEQYDLEGNAFDDRPSSPHSRSSTSSTEDHQLTSYRSPLPTPTSAAPFLPHRHPRRHHKHTASIASLIRADERVEDGWSPVGSRSFVFPLASAPVRENQYFQLVPRAEEITTSSGITRSRSPSNGTTDEEHH